MPGSTMVTAPPSGIDKYDRKRRREERNPVRAQIKTVQVVRGRVFFPSDIPVYECIDDGAAHLLGKTDNKPHPYCYTQMRGGGTSNYIMDPGQVEWHIQKYQFNTLIKLPNGAIYLIWPKPPEPVVSQPQ